MSVLVTGGGGFIGLHLARALAAQGRTVVVAENWSRTGGPDEDVKQLRAQPGVTFVDADLSEAGGWRRLPEGIDQVCHLAAINGTRFFYEKPYEVLRVNLLATVHLVDWLAATGFQGKAVFASSSEVYSGLHAMGALPLPTPETVGSAFADLANPRISYGVSKLAGELCVRHGARGWRWSIVRYHNVYGPRMGREHVIPELCERLNRREDPLKLFGATPRRAFCYVDDAVQATQRVLETPSTNGEVINIGNDTEEVTIRDLAERLIRLSGYRPSLEEAPAPEGSTMRRCPDLAKLRRLTGFTPAVALDEGLRRTWAWYGAHQAAAAGTVRP